MQGNYNTHNARLKMRHCIKRLEYFSSQANGSLCEVLPLPLKVLLLFLKKPPLLFESLFVLQRVAVMKERCRLIVK